VSGAVGGERQRGSAMQSNNEARGGVTSGRGRAMQSSVVGAR
jgi:hypothetical protein